MPQLKILMVAWGQHHIRRLDALGLASFLAPGNLPSISPSFVVELVILTGAADVETFEALPSMATVRRHASIRYLPIDDLIAPGQYSTTLHLAFMRGVACFGDQMTSMHFLFWNADFVLSDGALRHLAMLIQNDAKAVITGTLRCVAEQTDQTLLALRDEESGALVLPPRRLVELAFRYPHPHHVAKTVNQTMGWTSMPSQMLWRVDSETQLGRFFKAFMFCLKPTRVVTAINGPSDYALVPELCPGEPQHLIQNSDDAFILEVQDRDAESEFIFSGEPDEEVRRACMGEWLTPEHLDTGRRVVTFRCGAGAPAAEIASAELAFQDYFDQFMRGLASPNSHKGQYYWLFGVAAWSALRERFRPGQMLPSELSQPLMLEDLKSPTNRRHREALRRLKSVSSIPLGVRRPLFGEPHRPRALHPDAPSLQLIDQILTVLRKNSPPNGRTLIVAETGGWADAAFPDGDPRNFWFELVPAAFWTLAAAEKAQTLVVYLQAPQTLDIASLLQRTSAALARDAQVCVIWHDPGFKGRIDWIDAEIKKSLSTFGQLEGPTLKRKEAAWGDRRYAAAFYHAIEPDKAGFVNRCGRYIRLGVAVGGRLLGLAPRRPSGRTLLAVLTGRANVLFSVTSQQKGVPTEAQAPNLSAATEGARAYGEEVDIPKATRQSS